MNLRDAFEVFCARSAPTFRGITQPTNGMMDAKAWRKMLMDSKVYNTAKGLAKGVLIFSEVTSSTGLRSIDFKAFQDAIDKVGTRKGMTGSDISAYVTHMAQQFHQQAVEAGKSGTDGPLSKEDMKELIRQRNAERLTAAMPAPVAPKLKTLNAKQKKLKELQNSQSLDALQALGATKAVQSSISIVASDGKEKVSVTAPVEHEESALGSIKPKPVGASAPAAQMFVLNEKKSRDSGSSGGGGGNGVGGGGDTSGLKAPNLKEIARQNQALDAQKAMLRSLNAQLQSGTAAEEGEIADTGFSWDNKEKHSVKLRENATAWDWSTDGDGDSGKFRGAKKSS